jgi:predicted nucleic acid-binding protein
VPATERRLVVDASVVVKACLSPTGLTALTAHGQLAAPYLLWSEATAAFRELQFRGEIDAETANAALVTLLTGPIEPTWPENLFRSATDIAASLGWAKTYDAEYVALARFLDAPLVTVDARLMRRARALAHIIGPTELP